MRLIDLRNRAGEVVARTMVDDDAFDRFGHLPWHLDASGYAVHTTPRINGKQTLVRLNREVLGLGQGDARQSDHINGDRLDNRRANLRVVTATENMQNVRSRGGTSRHRGVSRRANGRWSAQIGGGRSRVALGIYATEEQAAEVARLARLARYPLTVEERSCA